PKKRACGTRCGATANTTPSSTRSTLSMRARARASPTRVACAPDRTRTTTCSPGAAARRDRARASPLRRALQPGDVELLHPEHRLHHARRLRLVGIAQELAQDARHDLPRHAEAIDEPAALDLLSALGERAPIPIDLLLRLAAHEERDALREGERRAAVE